MTESMPFTLVAAWTLFFGFVNTHQRHANRFPSGRFTVALQVSVLLGSIVGIALLGYYFTLVAWYWPIVLFLIGSLAGGILFGTLDAKVMPLIMGAVSFIGWPASAIWAFMIIQGLRS